jgi:clan AA aspartic protease
MISGTVSRHRAYVPLTLRGPSGQQGDADFVLDTGFTGFLTLPPSACAALALPFDHLQPSFLADGTQVMLDVHIATVLWDGMEQEVKVLAMEGAPLLGMSLLEGHDIQIQAVEGGLVTIELM